MMLFNKWNKSGLNALFQVDYLIHCEAAWNEISSAIPFSEKQSQTRSFFSNFFLVQYFVFAGVAFTSLE